MTFEYKVIPAPTRGQKGKGIKGPEGRFANALEREMNRLAAEGWEYVRADTLPSEERSGLTGSTTSYRSVLVFRRALAAQAGVASEPEPEVARLPAPEVSGNQEPPEEATPKQSQAGEPEALVLEEDDKTGPSAAKDPDEGETVSDVTVALKKRVETVETEKTEPET